MFVYPRIHSLDTYRRIPISRQPGGALSLDLQKIHRLEKQAVRPAAASGKPGEWELAWWMDTAYVINSSSSSPVSL